MKKNGGLVKGTCLSSVTTENSNSYPGLERDRYWSSCEVFTKTMIMGHFSGDQSYSVAAVFTAQEIGDEHGAE